MENKNLVNNKNINNSKKNSFLSSNKNSYNSDNIQNSPYSSFHNNNQIIDQKPTPKHNTSQKHKIPNNK